MLGGSRKGAGSRRSNDQDKLLLPGEAVCYDRWPGPGDRTYTCRQPKRFLEGRGQGQGPSRWGTG